MISQTREDCMLIDNAIASRRRQDRLRATLTVVLGTLLTVVSNTAAIDLSPSDALRIGKKVWQNECNGTIAGLTSWNEGEKFASLGIGHFIWYPAGQRGPFDESFPKLVSFAAARGVKLPAVLLKTGAKDCPWNSRSEFVGASNTPQMKELRQFLADTVHLQAQFLVDRLQQAMPKMLAEVPSPAERAEMQRQFERVAGTANGCYALVDYVNFKGEGVLDTERYRGQGWGLCQVLQGMSGNEKGASAVREFAESARNVLRQRVRNSPPERKESRWLAGWLQRINTYSQS